MECAICLEVCHPTCVTDYGVDGFIKMDLPNSWECPRCIRMQQDVKKREENIEKTEPESIGSDGSNIPSKLPKLEPCEQNDTLRRPISSGSDANMAGAYQLFSVRIAYFSGAIYFYKPKPMHTNQAVLQI